MLAIIAAITAFAPLSMDLYLPGLPDLQAELSASPEAARATVTGCIAGLALGQLVSGMLRPDRPRKPELLISMSAWVCLTIICACVSSVWVIVGLRVLQGLAAGNSIALARTVMADIDPDNLARNLSRTMLVLAAVPILAPAVGGFVLSFTNWRGLFAMLASVGVVLVVVVALILPESRRVQVCSDSDSESATTIRSIASARFLIPAVASGLGFGVIFAYVGESAFIFREH
ncbi:MAG: MFS transporter, partial [Pseudomonas sp.]